MNKLQKTLVAFIASTSILFLILTAVNMYFATWHIRQGEVSLHTDIARDFLLYDEIDQKKLILIGPRSSSTGLFHGPTWLYLTYPGYLLGNGDPVFMGWYWIALIVVFLVTSFFIAKSLFGKTAGWIYVTILSGNLIFHARGLLNPHGALFLIPFFLYTIIRYHETNKPKFLIGHLITAALIIQFQMAVGIPLAILSALYIVVITLKRNNKKHLLALLLVPIFLGNFFVFELRHDFGMTKAMLEYIKPLNVSGNRYDYLGLTQNRIDQMMDVQLTQGASAYINGALFMLMALLIYLQIKAKKQRHIYFLFVYFYLGYILLSFVNKGPVIYHQSFPMFALTNLMFASLVTAHARKTFIAALIVVLYLNFTQAKWYIKNSEEVFVGKNQISWKFLSKATSEMINTAPNDFGYFVYSPDAYAYQPHYAMRYMLKISGKNGERTTKKPVTYVLAAPPPPDNPFIQAQWWIENKAKITSKPILGKAYPNGYAWSRYELTEQELKSGIDPTADVGVFFR